MTASLTAINKLPVLKKPKSPGLSALIGVLTGGVGLAIYFRSLPDLFPVELTVGLVLVGSLIAGADPLQVAPFVAVPVGGLYGFWRAQTSNRRLAVSMEPAVALGTVV
jgi:hypothetical protein